MAAKQRLFTGLQPSGALHIGNYFGALKPFCDMYEDYESFLCAVDYHALTTLRNPDQLRQNTYNVVADYLAAGIESEHVTIFKQSEVCAHTELAWVFSCLVPISMLELGHAYKDTAGKGKEATAGLLTYPILMAADIVLYDTDVVPVGEDQRQHIEYAREIADKFNTTFGETFKRPREHILPNVAVVPGTDGRKMSKSYNNTIPLFADKDAIVSAVMGIITDSTGTHPEHVYAIHKLLRSESELKELYDNYAGNYKALKEMLIEDLESFIAPLREKRADITEADVEKVLQHGGEQARAYAEHKMEDVRKKIGVL
jgi:tryptophanyl-tRNA synthetase